MLIIRELRPNITLTERCRGVRIISMKKPYEKIKELKNTPYGEALEKSYRELLRSALYQSRIHGLGHIERTMLLGTLICSGEGFDSGVTRLCLLACSYHDIGRVDDSRDFYHGSTSAGMLDDRKFEPFLETISDDDLNILKAAISSHSDHDSNIPQYEEKYGVLDHDRFMKVVRTIKDADNLDRVRIGDLDKAYLRQETSKGLPETAQWIFDNMHDVSGGFLEM